MLFAAAAFRWLLDATADIRHAIARPRCLISRRHCLLMPADTFAIIFTEAPSDIFASFRQILPDPPDADDGLICQPALLIATFSPIAALSFSLRRCFRRHIIHD